MDLHWPSFLIGVSTPVVVLAAVLILARIAATLRSTPWSAKTSRARLAPFEPLRFAPRLIGKMRQPLEPKDHAQAS